MQEDWHVHVWRQRSTPDHQQYDACIVPGCGATATLMPWLMVDGHKAMAISRIDADAWREAHPFLKSQEVS